MAEYKYQSILREAWMSNDWADFWRYDVGINVIPSTNKHDDPNLCKKPFWTDKQGHQHWITWEKSGYQTNPISEEQHNQWKSNNAFKDGMAIICGQVFHNETNKGLWLNGIDVDNKLGLDEFCGSVTLEKIAKDTIVEQHANKEKFHALYYTKEPIQSKGSLSGDDIPHIEIKSGGNKLLYCAGGIHKDSSPIKILNSQQVAEVDKTKLERKIDNIFKKYGLEYLKTEFVLSAFQKPVYEVTGKIPEGGNRGEHILSYLDSKKIKNPELTEDDLFYFARKYERENCDGMYDDAKIRGLVKQAMEFGTRRILEQQDKQNANRDSEVLELENLTDIEKSEYAGKKVKVQAVISSSSIAYNVPKKVEAKCIVADEKHMCKGQTPLTVDLKFKMMTEFVDIKTENRGIKLAGLVKHNFQRECDIQKAEKETTTLEKFKIRPIISTLYKKEKEFFDDEGNKWSSYDIFIENNKTMINIEAGKEIEIVGQVMADPKNQKVTLFAESMAALNENEFEIASVKHLTEFFKNKTVHEKMDWLTREFEKYSKIVKRRNIVETNLLTFFSPLYIHFENELTTAWIKSVNIGDSTVGKSAVTRKMIILLKAGQIVSGEMATVAGLAGAAVQASGGQWFTDFGVLPMQDRKLLAIDGAHKLRKEELDKLAEAERNGKIEITKASKDEAYARTRQIKIMNPVDEDRTTTVSMDSFFYPVISLINNFQIQSIARIDLACFVSDNVGADERNMKMNGEYDPLLDNLSELLKLVWSMSYTVKIADEAMGEILKQSTLLENKFKTEQIPLVTNDQKYKLAKLSASLACLTCSFNDDFDAVTVTDEHVKYVSELIDREYSKAGLNELAKKTRFDKVTLETLLYEIREIGQKIGEKDKENAINILQWLVEANKFTKDDIQEHFNLSRDNQLRPLIGFLQDKKIIKRNKTGYSVLRYGIEIGRFIVGFSHSSRSSASEKDTPLINTNKINEGVSLLDELESLERRIFRDLHCKQCNTTLYLDTDISIEEAEESHGKDKEGIHELIEISKEPTT